MENHYKIIITIVVLIVISWLLGGSRVGELKIIGFEKAQEICGENSQVIYQGYERNILEGFGGKVWYQCKINNIWYQFSITTRLENKIPQVYNFEQKTTFPNQFELNK
jgi:hypothetical protein